MSGRLSGQRVSDPWEDWWEMFSEEELIDLWQNRVPVDWPAKAFRELARRTVQRRLRGGVSVIRGVSNDMTIARNS